MDSAEIARRHGVSPASVEALAEAIRRGGGLQAQFTIGELGGMGQWSRGGMTMAGSMSDHALRDRVDRLATELSDHLMAAGPERSARDWWPEDLGAPAATGSQNGLGYALFPEAGRLALREGKTVTLYDTTGHRPHGMAQSGGTLALATPDGPVPLSRLPRIGDDAAEGDPIATIERLADLHARGLLTDAEFRAKKAELLSRL